jgi:hypothetical protein
MDTRTGPGGYKILKTMCNQPKSNPAYIETFYSESPCAGRVSFKNAAMKKWEAKNGFTGYN